MNTVDKRDPLGVDHTDMVTPSTVEWDAASSACADQEIDEK